MEPLRNVSDPIADVIARRQYEQFQQLQDPANLPGARNYWKSHYLGELNDDAIEALVERAQQITSPERVSRSTGSATAPSPRSRPTRRRIRTAMRPTP